MSKSGIIGFVIGTGVGFGAGVLFHKIRNSKKESKDIDDIRKLYEEKLEKATATPASSEKKEAPKVEVDDILSSAPNVIEYAKRLNEERYAEKRAAEEFGKPYVISPDEFGEDEEFTRITYICYDDNVVVDEEKHVVDIDDTIGIDAMNHFGEYEDDAVYIRNDKLKIDYEVLRDPRTYEEVNPRRKPHQMGDD